MGSPVSKANKNFNETVWGRGGLLAKPEIPAPPPPPPPADTGKAVVKELSRLQTDQQLRRSKGRTQAFLSLDPYKGTTGR